jgi:outer membrane protein assembly factor BamB
MGPESAAPRRLGLAGALVFVLAVVGVAVMVRTGTGEPSGDVEAIAAPPIDDAAGVRSSAMPDLGGDVTLGPGDVPLLTASECPAQRLPSVADPLWEVELPDARRVITPVTVSEESVVAIVGFEELPSNGLPAVSVVALNADDGQERWRAGLQLATGRHEIIAVADGAVIVRSAAGPDMAYRRLIAFDEDSGALLWQRGFRGDWSATADSSTGLVYVGVRRPAVSATEESEVEVLDPRTGDRIHIAAGAYVGLDPEGRLVTRVGDKVLATSIEDRDLLGSVVPSDSPFTLVGTRVVVADTGAEELSVFSGDAEARRFPLTGSTGIDAPGSVVYLEPIGGSSLLVNGDGAVHGAQVGDGTIEIRWRVMGLVLGSAATDRGRSLLIATNSGARQRVVESSTGRTIVDLGLRPGASASLALAANGVVVQDSVDGEQVRLALDLDGRQLWSLAGSGPLAIGSGLVVDADDSDAVVRVSAWGDPVASRTDLAGCRSVMTEWIPR